MGWLTLLGVAGDLGLCGGGRMPKTLCGTFGGVLAVFGGGSWGPKRVLWLVACKADEPWLVGVEMGHVTLACLVIMTLARFWALKPMARFFVTFLGGCRAWKPIFKKKTTPPYEFALRV